MIATIGNSLSRLNKKWEEKVLLAPPSASGPPIAPTALQALLIRSDQGGVPPTRSTGCRIHTHHPWDSPLHNASRPLGLPNVPLSPSSLPFIPASPMSATNTYWHICTPPIDLSMCLSHITLPRPVPPQFFLVRLKQWKTRHSP